MSAFSKPHAVRNAPVREMALASRYGATHRTSAVMFTNLLPEAFGPLSLVRSRNCLDHLRLDQQHKELPLKRASLATALVASLAFMHTAAHAEGCTKGAVVGGVGGHVAGGHGVAGAAAGCAIGHHEAKKKDKAASAAAAASQPAGK